MTIYPTSARRLLVAGALSMLAAAPAAAEPLKIPLGIYLGAETADLWSTYVGQGLPNHYEVNYLGRWIDDQPAALVVFSAAAEGSAWIVAHRLARTRPRLAKAEHAALYVAAGIHAACAAWNIRTIRRDLRERRIAVAFPVPLRRP